MRDKHDVELEALFSLARSEQTDTTALEAHFETRLMSRLKERRLQAVPWHSLVWRMLPGFAVLAAIIMACSFAMNPTGYSDPFAAIANGHDDQVAKIYLPGE